MSVIIIIPLLVCLVGMLAYALSANGRIQELGRLAYGCGLLVTLFVVATRLVKL